MSSPIEHPAGWITGQLFSAGSAAAVRYAALDRLLNGNDPQRVRTRWRHSYQSTRVPHNEDNRSWVRFDGEPRSGRIPAHYAVIAALSADREKIDTILEREGGRRAVGYILSHSEVMVGTAVNDNEEVLSVDPDSDSRYVAGMGIGQGEMHAALGVRKPDGFFVPVVDTQSKGLVVPRADFNGPFV